jgi:hypothetical protein
MDVSPENKCSSLMAVGIFMGEHRENMETSCCGRCLGRWDLEFPFDWSYALAAIAFSSRSKR